jgi:hypothetical protein
VTKQIELPSGLSIMVAPLTVRQVKQYFSKDRATDTAGILDDNLAIISTAIGNAAPGSNEANVEWLQDNLNFPDLKAIHAEVLAISGLTAGEATAAKA